MGDRAVAYVARMAWFEDFFAGDWLDIQRAHTPPERAAALAEGLVRRLALPTGSEVLDVPCGHGPLALELAARGLHVTGVDLTESFLEEARTEARRRGLAVALERRDMRDLPWPGRFDLVLNWWSSLGFFDEAGERSLFEAWARVLKPAGRLVIETLVLETLGPQPDATRRSSQVAGLTLEEERRIDWIAGRVQTTWTARREGVVSSTRVSDLRLYSCAQLVAGLRAAGFKTFEASADLEGRPFGLGRRLLLVAGC